MKRSIDLYGFVNPGAAVFHCRATLSWPPVLWAFNKGQTAGPIS